MPAEEKIHLTPEGLKKTQEEYRRLIDIERPENVEALKAARDQGDLSENADYDAARTRQAQIEARIVELEHTLANYVLVDPTKVGKKIFLGNTVTYREVASGEEHTVKLVGSIEADPLAEPYPMISNECALGKALIDRIPDETKEISVESADPYDIVILKAVA